MTAVLVGAVIIGVATATFRIGFAAGKIKATKNCAECAKWANVEDETAKLIKQYETATAG
jgi:hypothetical protein